MKYSLLEKNLIEKIELAIVDVTPGVVVRAYQGGRIICNISAGHTYPYYDLASLTKIIFTVQAMMLAYDQQKWNLETTVKDILSWFPHKDVKIRDLLTHSSGLDWWLPFYKEMDLHKNIDERRHQVKLLLSQTRIQSSDVSVYSDLGFILLSYILESFYNQSILDVWKEIKQQFYSGTTIDFHPNNEPLNPRNFYAPTEECSWRKKLIQGEVHDENCWAMGGISTHAGLFGSIDDVSWCALNLRSQIMGIAKYHIRQKTAQLFTKRARPVGSGDWTLGYMLPSTAGASCGNYFSSEAIGHTGFTGTSLWYDPKMDMLIVILSNRILYGRDNLAYKKLRPEIHNWIVEGFRRMGA